MSSDFILAMLAVFIGVPFVFAAWLGLVLLMAKFGAFDDSDPPDPSPPNGGLGRSATFRQTANPPLFEDRSGLLCDHCGLVEAEIDERSGVERICDKCKSRARLTAGSNVPPLFPPDRQP